MSRLVVIAFLIIQWVHVEAQTPIVLTVGGNNPDFQTITEAINSIPNNPSNPYIINLRDGIYTEAVDLDVGASPINTITLQSESLDSSVVTIVSQDISLPTITMSGYGIVRKVTVLGDIDASHAPQTQILENLISGNVELRWTENSSIIGNKISGDLELRWADTSNISDNLVLGNLGMSWSENSLVVNNHVFGFFGAGGDSTVVYNNIAEGNASTSGNHLMVVGNIFSGDWGYSFSDYGKLIGNDCIGRFESSHSEESSYIGNRFHDYAVYTYGTYSLIINNLFHYRTTVSFCDETVIMFNNFSYDNPEARLYTFYPTTVAYNNLPQNVNVDTYATTLYGNNYASGISYNDPAPLFIDPMYDANLRSTNPQLTGTGQLDPLVVYDIDSVWRSNLPTIGANEICISNDTANTLCADSIVLGLCNLPPNGAYSWAPSIALSSASAQRPTVSTSQSRWYTVNDSISGFTDSVFVNVQPLTVSISTAFDSLLCGQQTALVATHHSSATYSWSPAVGLSSTTTQSVVASPEITTTYSVTAEVPGCGSTTSDFTVVVDPMPTAYALIDSTNGNYFQFLNLSACADTYDWDFGDLAGSTDEHPEHFFPDTGGTFLVTLIACNSFGCDTFQGAISFPSVVGIESQESQPAFTIYPNPTNADVTISYPESNQEIEIFVIDAVGRFVYSETRLSEFEMFLDLPKLPSGQYFISIFDGEIRKAQKLIISG